MRIIIDPEDDIQYMSFYIKGLVNTFGKEKVEFNFHAFDELPIEDRHTRSMRFIAEDTFSEKRYVIDTNDSYKVNETLYNWCDVYGSVNANFSKTPQELQKKLVSLCPSFAIRYTTIADALLQALKGVIPTHRNRQKYLGCWKRTLERPSLDKYEHLDAKENYIFHLSTLWQSDEWNRNDEGVNLRRAEFIRACRLLQSEVTFEGGLASSRNNASTQTFSDCLTSRLPVDICLKKTKESTIVFNTPAYWNCHGWKLGEYLALGKAILSTPLSNDLPAPLVHGQHIHITGDTQEEMTEAIRYMLSHPNYRHRLETNTYNYWQRYGTPNASLKLLGI